MANLSVRKLDNNVYEQLRIRAANHGVSMEEEARQIISRAVTMPNQITDVFRKYFGPKNGVDINLSQPRKPHEPMDFNE